MNDNPSDNDIAGGRGDRLSRLSEASLRISDSLDLDTVLREILDNTRSLIDARYSLINTVDEAGQVELPCIRPRRRRVPAFEGDAEGLGIPGVRELQSQYAEGRRPCRLREVSWSP